MYYWVMHIANGSVYAIGPYKTRDAANNRLEHVQGGQVDVFKTLEDEPQRAVDDYKSVLMKGG